mmetsp:Transcript_53483/g.95161  ORF Transcript_53483/g.95161 Transcript_53483/m.95161 type:complete len:129 (-) Transcript_53483:1028-1414(-)
MSPPLVIAQLALSHPTTAGRRPGLPEVLVEGAAAEVPLLAPVQPTLLGEVLLLHRRASAFLPAETLAFQNGAAGASPHAEASVCVGLQQPCVTAALQQVMRHRQARREDHLGQRVASQRLPQHNPKEK